MTGKSQVDLGDLDKNVEDDKEKKSSSSTRSRAPVTARAEKELRERLSACFERIADVLEQRGDEELTEILREDGMTMAQGLVSMTRPFRAFRAPLLFLVAVTEPALAFGRVARVLLGRYAERRWRVQAEREAQQAEEAQQE